MTMAKDESSTRMPDPLQMWREWVDQAERQWNQVLGEVMGSEQFGLAQGRVMEAMLGLQTSMNEATQRYFAALNLPSRTDILALGERLTAIESRLGDIERHITTTGAAATKKPATRRPQPKRTKKAPPKN
jgi:polyhydroxyalkanoic acid synthase PhaR subunit